MNRTLSVYLDLVRILAAVIVVLHHVWPLLFPKFPVPWPGHEAVVLFFVLSGYVIAFASNKPGLTAGDYAIQRGARVLSVAIPALILSVLIAPVADGDAIKYASAGDNFWPALLINAFFLGQSFSLNEAVPFNAPFWSICYEVWYYVIFAAWTFSSKRWRWRVLATVLALVIAGPKIITLLPVWLLGVALFHYMPKFSHRTAIIVFAATVLVGFAFFWFGVSTKIRAELVILAPNFMAAMKGSNQFVGDFLLGLIVALNFAAVASIAVRADVLTKVEPPIRAASSVTFSTYLYHMPLTVFIWNGLGIHNPWLFLAALAALIIALGLVTERKVHVVRRLFARLAATPRIA